MNIYQFINSKDIRTHCEKIAHQFNAVEAAFLIHHSRLHSIAEKHAAWQELIRTMPDMPIKPRKSCKGFDSMHLFLQQYMSLENALLQKFFASQENCVYRFCRRSILPDGIFNFVGKCVYSNFLLGLASENKEICMKSRMGGGEKFESTMIFYCVDQYTVVSDAEEKPTQLFAYVDINGTPYKIGSETEFLHDEQNDLLNAFDEMWINVPTPFQKGDIVFDAFSLFGHPHAPFVLEELSTDINNPKSQELLENGNIGDMCAYGYGFNFEKDSEFICYGYAKDYLYLEYYRNPLTGRKQILKPISRFVKEEIDVYTLVDIYHNLLAESSLKNSFYFLN